MKSFDSSIKQESDILSKNKTEIDSFAKDHTDKAINTFSNLTTDIRGLMDEFIADQKRLIETSSLDIQKKLESNQSEIISKLEGIPPQVISISESFEDSRMEKFSKASSEMDNAIDLFEKEVNNWAGDLNSIISQEVSSVVSNITDKKAETKENFTAAVKNLSDSQTELNQKFAENIKNAISTISSHFSEHEPTLSDNIDADLNQFDDQLTKFIEKSRDQASSLSTKATDFQPQSTTYKTNSIEAYDKIERNSKVQFENISKTTENLLKSMGGPIQTKKPT